MNASEAGPSPHDLTDAPATIAEILGDKPFALVDFAQALACCTEAARNLLSALHTRGSVVVDGWFPHLPGRGRPRKRWRIVRPQDPALQRIPVDAHPPQIASTLELVLQGVPFDVDALTRAMGWHRRTTARALREMMDRGSVVQAGRYREASRGGPRKTWRLVNPQDPIITAVCTPRSTHLTRADILGGTPFDRVELAHAMRWTQSAADQALRELKERRSVALHMRIRGRAGKGGPRTLWILICPHDPAFDVPAPQAASPRAAITDRVVEVMVDLGPSFSLADLTSAMGWSTHRSQAALQAMERKGWVRRRGMSWRPQIAWSGRTEGLRGSRRPIGTGAVGSPMTVCEMPRCGNAGVERCEVPSRGRAPEHRMLCASHAAEVRTWMSAHPRPAPTAPARAVDHRMGAAFLSPPPTPGPRRTEASPSDPPSIRSRSSRMKARPDDEGKAEPQATPVRGAGDEGGALPGLTGTTSGPDPRKRRSSHMKARDDVVEALVELQAPFSAREVAQASQVRIWRVQGILRELAARGWVKSMGFRSSGRQKEDLWGPVEEP